LNNATAADSGFNAFLAQLQEPGKPIISPLRFAQMLHLEQQKLAELAHVHRNTVSRMPASPRLQDFLRDAVRVLAAAFTWRVARIARCIGSAVIRFRISTTRLLEPWFPKGERMR
jgi:hypothetical protein